MSEAVENPELPRWKKVLFWSILFFVLIFGLLGIGEVASIVYLRATRGYDGEHLYQYVFDPYKNLLPTPNFVDTRGVRHNSVGFRRSSEVEKTKPRETLRIFLMGGSTAYGLGGLWPNIEARYRALDNSETIDAYLERLLAVELPGIDVEVVNAAITSTWTHHELIYLNQTILRYDPDIVLFLDGFNDYFHTGTDHDQFASYTYGLQSSVIMGPPTLYAAAYGAAWWLFRKSAFAHLVSRAARVPIQLTTGRPNRSPVDVELNLERLQATFPDNALAMHRRSGVILKDADVHPVFLLQPLLILQRQRAQMVGVERELFEFNVESYRPGNEEFYQRAVPYLRETEGQMADEIGASYVDLTSVFDTVPGQVFTDYAHLTPLGNEIVAKRILELVVPLVCVESYDESAPADIRGLRELAAVACPEGSGP